MANIDITSEENAKWATATHGEERLGQPPVAPSQMKWSQFDPTPRAAFKLAMTRLEGLMYVVYGSRADYANGLQWYEREHPRCMWGAETWQQIACDDSLPSPWEYALQGKEHSAFGSWPPCCVGGDIRVPIRSRSEDPEFQWFKRAHFDAVFPHGSIDRDLGTTPFDPQSTTALFPYLTPAPQNVEVRWVKPAALQTPTSVTLVWNGSNNVTMTLSGGAYRGTIPAQAQSTTVYWYVKVVLPAPSDADTQPAAGTYYDPLVGAAPGSIPSSGQSYSLVYFTHYNPYSKGLPEMLDICRKGTDRHEFDGSETVQHELINMARFCLQSFGSGIHKQALHHSPLFREGAGVCCVGMPIRFRFSGSNKFPHYVEGGKGGYDRVRPLHNNPHEHPSDDPDEPAWGSLSARATWRGIDMIYKGNDHFLNYWYGRGASWNPFPEEVIIEGAEVPPFTYQVYERYPDAGLQPGDVITDVHLWEIVKAVEFLVQHGLWQQIPVKASRKTPVSYMGYECGYACLGDELTEECNCDTGGNLAGGFANCSIADFPSSCLSPLLVTGSKYESVASVDGWCGFFCGPTAYDVDEFGNPTTDTLHGNRIVKRRLDHVCTGAGPHNVGTGPSQGNKFGDLRQCGQDTAIGAYPRLWFEQMVGHCFNGLAGEAGWLPTECNDCGFGPIAGLGSFHVDGTPICEIHHYAGVITPIGHLAQCGHTTACDVSTTELVCLGCYAWAAIDLNLDGMAAPYGGWDGSDIPGAPDSPDPSADMIPTLYNYDLSVDPAPESECPCETATGPDSCGT